MTKNILQRCLSVSVISQNSQFRRNVVAVMMSGLPLFCFIFFQMHDGCVFTTTSVILLECNLQNKARQGNLLFCCVWPEWMMMI